MTDTRSLPLQFWSKLVTRHINPHPVVRGPHGPRSDGNRHFTRMESDRQKSFDALCHDVK